MEKRHAIFLSDDYISAEKSWIDECAKVLQLTADKNDPSERFYEKHTGAYGFTVPSGAWKSILETWKNIPGNNPTNITDIIIGGGIYDTFSGCYGYGYKGNYNLNQCVDDFFTYVLTEFPNAKVYCCYLGWALDTRKDKLGDFTFLQWGMTSDLRYLTRKMWTEKCEMINRQYPGKAKYLYGCDLFTHHRSFFNGNATSEANIAIGRIIGEAIKSEKNISFFKKKSSASVAPASGVISGNISQIISNSDSYIQFNNFKISSCCLKTSSWLQLHIADIQLPFSNGMQPISIPTKITTSDGNTNTYNCLFYIVLDKLYMSIVTSSHKDFEIIKIEPALNRINFNPYMD